MNCVRQVYGVTRQKTVAIGGDLLVKMLKHFGTAQSTVEDKLQYGLFTYYCLTH
jgi:hypothetical protein